MCKKVLTYINFVFTCLSTDIQSVNITGNSRENFIKFSAEYSFSFSGIGPKTKTRNWWKVFKTCRIPIKTSLTLSKGLKNLLKYTGLISN